MKKHLLIAASQFPVSGKVARNYKYIEKHMKEVATQNVSIIHFPETSLSGYSPTHFKSLENYDWKSLEDYTGKICELAYSLNLWVILGTMRCNHNKLPGNCIKVISDKGKVVGTYDKQRLYGKEKEYYSPGNKPLVVKINGFECGFLICYDNCFPELYDTYRKMNVELLFHSVFNAGNSGATNMKNLMHANSIIRAADNQMWISVSNSSKYYSPLSAGIYRPDGSMVKATRHTSGIVIDDYPMAELGWTYDNSKK